MNHDKPERPPPRTRPTTMPSTHSVARPAKTDSMATPATSRIRPFLRGYGLFREGVRTRIALVIEASPPRRERQRRMEAAIVEGGTLPVRGKVPSLPRIALHYIRSASCRGFLMRQYRVGREDRLPFGLPQPQTKIDVAELDRISLRVEAADRIEFALLDSQAGTRNGRDLMRDRETVKIPRCSDRAPLQL